MAHGKYFRLSLLARLVILGLGGFSNAQGQRKTRKVLIEAPVLPEEAIDGKEF